MVNANCALSLLRRATVKWRTENKIARVTIRSAKFRGSEKGTLGAVLFAFSFLKKTARQAHFGEAKRFLSCAMF